MANLFDDQISRAAGTAQTFGSGDVYIVQGDCSSAGTAAIANRYLGSITETDATVLFDGYVFEIDVANVTNAIVGLAITGGTSGATAVITQILTSTRLKYRYTNNLFFANAETITGTSFSAVASSAPRLSNLTILGLQNNTVSGNGLSKLTLNGCLWQLGTSNGTTQQSFNAYNASVFSAVLVQYGESVSIANATATITAANQFNNGDAVQLVGTLTGAGLANATTYYIVNATWDGLLYTTGASFSLATTKGGSAIAPTANASSISVLKGGFTFSTTNGSSVFTCPSGHNLSIYSFTQSSVGGDSIALTIPTANGLLAYRTYYVVAANQATGTFSLSLTPGGSAISATATTSNNIVTPDSIYVHYLNLFDRPFSQAGNDRNHGRFCKQVSGSNAIAFGENNTAYNYTTTFVNASTTLTTSANHNRSVGDIFTLTTTGTLPTNFAINTIYYVLTVPSATTLTVSTTFGGTVITAGSAGSGTHTLTVAMGGRVPVNGSALMLPNVTVGNTTSGTAPTPGVPASGTSATVQYSFNQNYAGDINLIKANLSGGLYLNGLSKPRNFIFNYLQFFFVNFVLTNSVNPITGVGLATATPSTTGTGSTFSNCVFYTKNFNFLGHAVSFNIPLNIGAQNSLLDTLKLFITRAQGDAPVVGQNDCSRTVWNNFLTCGGKISLNGTDQTFSNHYYTDRPDGGIPSTANGCYVYDLNGSRNVFSGLVVGSPPGLGVANTSQSIDTIVFKNATIDLQNNTSQLVNGNNAKVTNNLIFSNFIAQNIGSILNLSGGIVRNLKAFNSFNTAATVNIPARTEGVLFRGVKATTTSVSGVIGTGIHALDNFTSTTAGKIQFYFFEKSTDYYSVNAYTLSGSPVFDRQGSVLLRSSTTPDRITIRSRVIFGHTGLSSATVAGTNVTYTSGGTYGNHLVQYRIVAGTGAISGTYKDLTTANLTAETISPTTGFQIELQISCSTTSTSNAITGVTIVTTSSGVAQSALNYPYLLSTFVVTGLVAGTVAGLFDAGNNLIETGTGTTVTFSSIEFFTTAVYTIKYRAYGYREDSIVVSLADGIITNAVIQSLDPFITVTNAATVAAYSNISVGYAPRTLTVGALTQQQIYDFAAYTDAQFANIAQAVLINTSDGQNLTLAANLTLTGIPTGAGSIGLGAGYNDTIAVAGTYTGLAIAISSTGRAILAAGTSVLSNWVFASGAKIDNSSASAVIAIVGASQIGNITAASPTVGGGTVTITLSSVNTFSGLLTGSTIALFSSTSTQNSSTLVESGTVSGTSYTFAAINFTGTVTYSYRVRLFGYIEVTGLLTLTSGTANTPISQVANPFITVSVAATVAAYTGIAINHSTQAIAQTVSHSRAELYDYIRYNGALLANIVYTFPVTTANGADLSLTYDYSRSSCALTGTGSLSLPSKTATITSDSSAGQLPITDSTGLRFRVYGLPTSNSPVMRSKRVSNSVITNPTINSNGEAYFTIVLGENYQLRADAVGYAASDYVTINSNTGSSLQLALSQYLDSNGTVVYGQGTAGEKALITFNPSTLAISIVYSATYPTISLYSAFDKIEELLATTTAIEFTAHPVYSNGTILFPRDIVSNAANPARIQANASNTGIPTLTFQVVDQANPTPYNLFDFSNGKTINYPTTVNVSAGGNALTQQQVRDAALLAPTTGLTAAASSVDGKLAVLSRPVIDVD